MIRCHACQYATDRFNYLSNCFVDSLYYKKLIHREYIAIINFKYIPSLCKKYDIRYCIFCVYFEYTHEYTRAYTRRISHWYIFAYRTNFALRIFRVPSNISRELMEGSQQCCRDYVFGRNRLIAIYRDIKPLIAIFNRDLLVVITSCNHGNP